MNGIHAALPLVKEFEDCPQKDGWAYAYPDPLTKGEPITIGYGSTQKPDGGKWKLGDRIPVQMAEHMLLDHLAELAVHLSESIPHWHQMNNNQRGALISFAYNLGPNFYGSEGFKAITNALRFKNWAGVPSALELYRNPGTNVEAGLLRRRRAEGSLWRAPV